MSILFIFSISTLLLIILSLTPHFLSSKRSNPNSKSETKFKNIPPSPPKCPILGNLHQLGKLPHQDLRKLSLTYGPVMLLQLGNIPTLVISSASMAKEILKTHDLTFCTRPHSPGARRIFYDFSDVAFSPYNDKMKERRKIMVSQFLNSKKAESFGETRENEVNHLVGSLFSVSESEYPINLDEHVLKLIDGIITTIAFGEENKGKKFKGYELKDVFEETMDVISSFSAEDFFPKMGWILDVITGKFWKLSSCFNKLNGYLDRVVNEHCHEDRGKMGNKDFADVLIGLSKQGHDITAQHVKAMLMDTYLGGVDTSAITMVWAMTELIKNPRAMKKAQSEIRGCIGDKHKIDAQDLRELTYLKMVIKETLRLHPPVPLLIPRECMRKCRIGGENGYDVDAKTRVLVNVWAIGRDPKSWNNPNEFLPERFEDSEVDFRGQNFELLPFGGGRRVCPGINMAMMAIELTMANLLYWFDWKVPSGMKLEDISLEEEGSFIVHKKIPLALVPLKHN